MRYIYAVVMLAFAVIAFYHTTKIFHNKTYKVLTWCLYTMLAFASGVWSLGYGVMFITEDMNVFAVFRVVGMVGIVLAMIFGQMIIGFLSENIKRMRIAIALETIVGMAVVALFVMPGSYKMIYTDNGIVTEFTSATISIIYTLYVVLVAFVFVFSTVRLCGDRYPGRIRDIGKALLKLELLIGAGMIVDTLLPAFGINFNIPASTILQFGGLEICNKAVLVYNRNVLDMGNMSSYITHSVKTPILIFDKNNALKNANAEAKKFFSISDEDLQGENSRNFWNKVFGADETEIKYEEAHSFVIDKIDTLKHRNCRLIIDSIEDKYKDYLGFIVTVYDMTREFEYVKEINSSKDRALKLKEEAELAREEAETANKAKSQFLANMSHEMRTPMNAIIGFSEMALRKDMGIDDDAREYFEDINTSARGLLSIVNSILDISKIESGKMEIYNAPYNLKEIINEVSSTFKMLAEKKGLKLQVESPEQIPEELYGDKGKIREILYNIVNNAVKYTEEGTISLKIAIEEMSFDRVMLQFIVEDTGVGIKEENLQNIFESFRRVDLELNRKTEGTGLGLSIVKGYVEIMGGKISVDSVYGEGSKFAIEIPQKLAKASYTEDKAETVESEKSDKTKMLKEVMILAVDDIKVNLKVVSELCKMYGGICDTATSGLEAVKAAQEKEYDIILMDQMMPVMDGIEAMHKIRDLGGGYEKGGAHKIIALTANAMSGSAENMINLGFDGFLGKPINISELEKVLSEYVGKK